MPLRFGFLAIALTFFGGAIAQSQTVSEAIANGIRLQKVCWTPIGAQEQCARGLTQAQADTRAQELLTQGFSPVIYPDN